jgi:hypothetical protein
MNESIESVLAKAAENEGSLSISDLYREAGYLYRHCCRSRTAVLAVTMPIIFSMAWILLSQRELGISRQVAVTTFGGVIISISVYIDAYYARRINFMKQQMEHMELRGERRTVHSNIDELIVKLRIPRTDALSKCVYAITALGILLALYLYPTWVNN